MVSPGGAGETAVLWQTSLWLWSFCYRRLQYCPAATIVASSRVTTVKLVAGVAVESAAKVVVVDKESVAEITIESAGKVMAVAFKSVAEVAVKLTAKVVVAAIESLAKVAVKLAAKVTEVVSITKVFA